MITDTLKLTTLVAALGAAPLVAFAGLNLGDQVGTTEADIRAAMDAQGLEVLEIDVEDDQIEVEYLLDGVEYEAEVDPATGIIIAVELEDDEDDDS